LKTESDGGIALDKNGKVLLVGDTVKVREPWKGNNLFYIGTTISVGSNHCTVSLKTPQHKGQRTYYNSYFAFQEDTERWEPEDRI
jgi:hypothetical protein